MLILLMLLMIQHWITGTLRRRASQQAQVLHHGRIVSARPQFFILNDQAISLILGLIVSLLLIWHPGGFLYDEYREMQKLIKKR